jgi:hypothetical protein
LWHLQVLCRKEMSSKFSLKSDLLAMNVSWCPHELELYTNRSSITMSTIFTIILIITFLMGVIVQKAIFKLLNRLPQRAINQIIYPYMVKKSDRHILKILYIFKLICISLTFLIIRLCCLLSWDHIYCITF